MVERRTILGFMAGGLVAAGAAAGGVLAVQRARRHAAQELFEEQLTPPDGPVRVYHLGHSLVGRDMPAMLAQLAPEGHDYASQLGWGASLRAHWEPDTPVNGFDEENNHARFAPATAALESGDYDAVVLTEMVELKDAIKYHDTADYLGKWGALARAGRPDVRLFFYETWHHTNDPAGWLSRIDADFEGLWLDRVVWPAARKIGAPIFVIPGGQVLAAFVRAVESRGGVGIVKSRDDLMARTPQGAVDTIHLGDLGAYLIALTHYAVLYQRDPAGLPLALERADGTAADAPDPESGALMQRIVWEVVQRQTYSGLRV